MTFRYFPLRFRFVARTTLSFPAFLPGNVIRSAFGASLRRVGCLPGCDNPSRCPSQDPCPYRTIFQPEWIKGPSGFRQPPRPFVLRANHLSGKLIEPGSRFDFQVFVFDTRRPVVEWLVRALQEWEQDGWGPGRSSVTLESVELAVSPEESHVLLRNNRLLAPLPAPVPLSFDSHSTEPCGVVRVHFLSPTELKENGTLVTEPQFHVLAARARDRILSLSAIYQAAACDVGTFDCDCVCAKAGPGQLRLTRSNLTHLSETRRSRETGTHPLGGFVGEAVYEGDAAPFISLLRVAEITGIGRQTVWGKGEIRVMLE